MSIPEAQLLIWANQGATTTAMATHEAVRRAINSYIPLKGKNFEVYLQGSYRNFTNIRGDSDVDLVVQLNSFFITDISALTVSDQIVQKSYFEDALYSWKDFRNDVFNALEAYFGKGSVEFGNKSLKLARTPNRLATDVVPSLQYRKYTEINSYIEGMTFYTLKENTRIINYPKLHYDNGSNKNSYERTKGRFKPSVRMFKNARTRLRETGVLGEGVAPSYFLQCMLYNVPDDLFVVGYSDTYYNVVKWMSDVRQANELDKLICQNGQTWLFGPTVEQWSINNAIYLIDALIKLWNQWGK